ncbi:hypothetical protein C1634_025615 [Chryseobacterium viscerum]|uniref:Uncharacterized protein n=1 Tax=Chryseobacterium viscerum TaxID=1037377 RepID=A0A316WFX1_9FLAO|nr:hypothetical protein C1634_025615 [Chryseobacterium viscerum]
MGVGTVSPKVTLDVAARAIDGSAAEGFKVPMLTGNALYAAATNGKYTSSQDGAIVHVTTAADVSKRTGQTEYIDSSGLYYFNAGEGSSGKWLKLSGGTVSPVLGSLDCNGSLSVGHLYSGEISNGVSSVVSYTNGNGAAYNAQDILSTGVTGLTAHLSAGSLSNGNGSLTYTISGTPSGPGTASFAIGIGGQSCTLTRTVVLSSTVSSLDCSGAVNSGTLTEGSAVSGVSSVISYTGGNGGLYSAQSVSSTGVTGLTAALSSGTLANGNGSVTYTISGTPSGSGTASFSISIGGKSCILTRKVTSSITIPSGIILGQNVTYFVTSVYDKDYLPYTVPTGDASTNVQAADGSNEMVTVNVQGTITPSGVKVNIPVKVEQGGILPAYSTTITIPADMTEDGVSRNLTLSWASQACDFFDTKFITATIKAIGGTLNAKKLDINSGIGNDALGVLMGQFTYPYNNAGNTTSYSVRDIAGIPDRMFGVADNTGNSATHMMLYSPVVAEDGKVWLNNNLGAHYANINHASFNPGQQAMSSTDYLAYGSLFQWGRKPDGHELINWGSGGTPGTPVYGKTSTLSNMPSHALFIVSGASPFDWRTTQDDTLWLGLSGANNPCPSGFRVPTDTEIDKIRIMVGANIENSALKFSFSGARIANYSDLADVGSLYYFWTSSVNGVRAIGMSTVLNNIVRGNANSVRCIKD